jgi:hypothetical protein
MLFCVSDVVGVKREMSSGLVAATPPPATELPTIYRSGDLVLQNPQETCIIFVSVILISALLEYGLQRLQNVGNKYARILVNTMSQEVTIIGVLALFLMFSVSVIPKRYITPLFVSLFSWANMSLFFMAAFFILNVVYQFAFAAIDSRRWKTFEEGRLDSEELATLSYRERRYKQCYDLYRQRLDAKAGLSPSSLPFYEYINRTLHKQLVRVSNLSYRTWLSLSVVVLANLVRTMLTPWVTTDEADVFYNSLLFVLVVGWGILLVFLAFFGLQQWRLLQYARGQLEPVNGDARSLIPFGTPKRTLEFLQVIIMSFNWYLTLFVTGNAKEISKTSSSWRLGTIYTLFAVPLAVFVVVVPWTFYTNAMLATIGGIEHKEANRVSKALKGEADEDSEDDAEDERSIAPTASKADRARQQSDKGSKRSRGRSQSVGSHSTTSAMHARPAWLEEDDDWDGYRTAVPGARRTRAVQMDRTFYSSVDTGRLRRMLAAQSDVPTLSRAEAQNGPTAAAEDDRPRRPGKPIWWESDDEN